MKTKFYRIVCLLCAAVLALSGCAKKPPEPQITETQQWEEMPALTFGTMEYEKLSVLPWHSGRSDATGNSQFAETETGYYITTISGCLQYADRTDLSVWTPVCNKPNCAHGVSPRCNALYEQLYFVIRDERIYTVEKTDSLYETVPAGLEEQFCLVSRAMDGSDMRIAYQNAAFRTYEGGAITMLLRNEHWLFYLVKLNPDGSFTYEFYRVSEEGTQQLVDHTQPDFPGGRLISSQHRYIRGDSTFNHPHLGEDPDARYRFVNGELITYDLTGYGESSRYLSGNTLRIFRKNDGYYDVNLQTKEEVRIGDAQIENAESYIFLPNCIIESTLFYGVYKNLPAGSKNEMMLYDGESWRSVQLPQELLEPAKNKTLSIAAITSDSIFLIYRESSTKNHLYRIPIGDEELTLHYCARLQ